MIQVRPLLESTLSGVVNALFPDRCFECQCRLAPSSEAALLCDDCADLLPALEMSCPRCGVPMSNGQLCGQCIARPPKWRAAAAVWCYEGLSKALIQRYKFRGELRHERGLLQVMGELGQRYRQSWADVDMVLPVALHPLRRARRGFNQSEPLAMAFAEGLGARCVMTAVERQRHTRHLAYGLSRKERRRVVRRAFSVVEDVRDKHLVLVDDVMTSGATLEALSDALLKAGAASVRLAVLARTPAPHRGS